MRTERTAKTRNPLRKKYILMGGGGALTLIALAGLFAFGLFQNQARLALGKRNQLLQKVSSIMTHYFQENNLSTLNDPGIISLAIYSEKGQLEEYTGAAPPSSIFPPRPQSSLEIKEESGTLTMTILFASRIQYPYEDRDFNDQRGPGRGMMSPMTRPMPGMRPPEENRRMLRMVYDTHYLEGGLPLYIIPTLFFLAIVFLSIFLAGLIREILRLQKDQESKGHLIQMGEAARTLAHEIRNPLGILRLQQTLLKRKLPPEYTEDLKILEEEIGRINQLVERVGEFLQNPRGTVQEIEVVSFIENLIDRMDENIRIEQSPSLNSLSPVIEMDTDKFRSVIENLLKNARESGMPPQEPLLVCLSLVSRKSECLKIEVKDKGTGFDPHQRDNLFDPFYTTKDKGSGIGLAVSRRFIEAAGGTLTARNRQNGGACFTITMPSRLTAKENPDDHPQK